MLFYVFLAIFVVLLVVTIIKSHVEYGMSLLVIPTVLVGCIALIMGLCAFVVHVNNDGENARMKQRYESLTYQLENDVYGEDGDVVGNRELHAEITEYNKTVAQNRALGNNIWFNVFVEECYKLEEDEGGLPLISLKG